MFKIAFSVSVIAVAEASQGYRHRPLPWDGSDSRASPGFKRETIPHIGGRAELTETGYQAVAATKKDDEMESFARRVIALRGYKVSDQGKLHGVLPYFSGSKGVQSMASMEHELLSDFHSLAVKRSSDVEVPELTAGVHVQIMGLFDTGTNLLSALIEKNFPADVFVYDMPHPSGKYWRQAEAPGCVDERNGGKYLCSFWKHANLDVLKSRSGIRLQELAAHKVVGIAMVREPMSWLQSIRKEGYDFAKNGNKVNTADWLTRSVTASPIFYGNEGDVTWANLEEIWNNQTRSYQNLSAYGFPKTLVIRYEDLVVNTTAVMNRVAEVIGVNMTGAFSQVEESAKGGDSTGHDAAVAKIHNKTYLTQYSQSEKVQACSVIDKDLAAKFDYNDCKSATAEWAVMRRQRIHFGDKMNKVKQQRKHKKHL